MPLTLESKSSSTLPLELEGVLPEKLNALSLKEFQQLPVWLGKEKLELGELFQVSGDGGDRKLIIENATENLHWLGAHMSEGEIEVRGSVGRHSGSQMTGGRLAIQADANDWLGAEMSGGTIFVGGNTGDHVGGAYPGSPKGMKGGTILVNGSTGLQLGSRMRRGTIAIGESAGPLAGFHMLAGTILIYGKAGAHPGAGMKRGTIGLLGGLAGELLPTFKYACQYQPQFLAMLERHLSSTLSHMNERLGTADQDRPRNFLSRDRSRNIKLFHGDFIEEGRGELLLPI